MSESMITNNLSSNSIMDSKDGLIDDTNAQVDDEKPIFSIRDYNRFIIFLTFSIISILGILYILNTSTPEQRAMEVGSHTKNRSLSMLYVGLITIIMQLLFMKKEMIYFYKDKVVYQQGRKYKEIILNDSVSCYMGHIYSCRVPRDTKSIKIYKSNSFLFIFGFIICTFFLITPIMYISSFIYYKEISLNLKALTIADNNLNVISIPYYKRDKEEIIKYFKSTLNIDISKLHTMYSVSNLIKKIKGKQNEK